MAEHSSLEAEAIAQAGVVGADAGWSGFIYNHEAAAFFDAHEELIWDLLHEDANEMGHKSPMEMIATFSRIDMAETFTGLKVLLSWYALETAGRALQSLD